MKKVQIPNNGQPVEVDGIIAKAYCGDEVKELIERLSAAHPAAEFYMRPVDGQTELNRSKFSLEQVKDIKAYYQRLFTKADIQTYCDNNGFPFESMTAPRFWNIIQERKKKDEKLPIGDIAKKILTMLKKLPETDGLTSDEISERLCKEHKIILDASTIRKNHLKQLEPYGLRTSQHGYCIR